jgi:hypothetical protein
MSDAQDKLGNDTLISFRSGNSSINLDNHGNPPRQRDRGLGRDGGERGSQGRTEGSRVTFPRIVNGIDVDHDETGTPVIPWKIHQLSQEGHSFGDLESIEDLKYSNRHYALKVLRESRNLAPDEISLPGKVSRFVPPTLRSTTLRRYPILEQHDGHRAFFLYLLTTTFRDVETRNPVISAEQIARCYGDEAQKWRDQGNLKTSVILRRFSSDITYIEWSSPNHRLGDARTLQYIDLDDSLRKAWEEALSSPIGEDAVYFWSGRKRARVKTRQTEHREKLRERSRAQTPPCEDSKRWRDYLNARDPSLFESVLDRLPKAYCKVREDPEFRGQKREEAIRHLQAIEEQPIPIYGFSGNTVRLTALNPSLQTIDGDLRHILTEGWIELDLSSAQLAIAGKDWGVQKVVDFLSEGKSIWKDLSSFLSLPMRAKPALKKGLYSAVYGALENNILWFILEKAQYEGVDVPKERAKQFTEHPLVQELLEAREEQLDRIREDGGAENCYEQWIDYDGIEKKKPQRSILAQLNQAREMWLLEPVLRRAEEQDEGAKNWDVTLLQHDGFSIKVHNGQGKQVVETLQNAVAELAEHHGYPTRLEIESME